MTDTAHSGPAGAHSHDGQTRRDFLTLAGTAITGVGAAATLWPLISSMNPAKDTLALSTTEVDLSPIQLGQRVTVTWRGHPVFIDHRPEAEIKAALAVNVAELRDPQPMPSVPRSRNG